MPFTNVKEFSEEMTVAEIVEKFINTWESVENRERGFKDGMLYIQDLQFRLILKALKSLKK